MKNYIKVQKTVSEICSITCDACNVEYKDSMETQEFLNYNDTCGYMSIFGDNNRISLDLCQHCIKRLLGKYIRITNYEDILNGLS